jgi:hypothetical protein
VSCKFFCDLCNKQTGQAELARVFVKVPGSVPGRQSQNFGLELCPDCVRPLVANAKETHLSTPPGKET